VKEVQLDAKVQLVILVQLDQKGVEENVVLKGNKVQKGQSDYLDLWVLKDQLAKKEKQVIRDHVVIKDLMAIKV
jgi:hypothetical protein